MNSIETRHDNTPVKLRSSITNSPLPNSCRVLIVGGGIAGASLAYHFGQAGWQDVVVLEQNQIASGTTWHSAGQVGQLRSSSAQTKVNKASVELYSRLHSETGHNPGWLQCGGLQLATCNERMLQLNRQAAMAEVFDVQAELISAEECLNYWPMLNTSDIIGAAWLPGDGRVLPGECTFALAIGAHQRGVRFVENLSVYRLMTTGENKNGVQRIIGVETSQGPVTAEWVILAGNMWMRQLAAGINVDIPVYPCEHHYVVTRPIDGVTRNSPCTRDPDAGLYFRALDDGGLKLGAFKKRSKPWQIGDCVPNNFAFALLEPDWEDFLEPFQAHCHRLNGINKENVVKFVNGPEAFTPDNNFIIGQPHLTEGLFVMGGWNSAGIACAGGAGKYAVEWIENGGMTIDLHSVDILRFLPFQNRREYLQDRVSEVLGLHYQMAWPGRQMETARNRRTSKLYDIHRSNNACFGETSGWERPLFYAPKNVSPAINYSFEQQNWHEWVCCEVHNCRTNVALIDQSTFAKFELSGPDALDCLQWLCGANIDVPVGKAVYTGMFNKRGTFEADLTVVRLAQDHFYIVTATGQQQKDFDWISRHINDHDCRLLDVTEQKNVLSVMGPKAHRVLEKLLPRHFLNADVPYGTAARFKIASLDGLALRISYVGEAGWELHLPAEAAVDLYRMLEMAGATLNIQPAGNYAVSAMRIERGFRAYGHEISTDESPLEAGLGWAIGWSKKFLGKDALLAQKKLGLTKRLLSFRLNDPDVTLYGGEPIYWNGKVAGYTTSACYGPTLGSSVAMGYVRKPDGSTIKKTEINHSTFQIKCNGLLYETQAGFDAPMSIAQESPKGLIRST